MSIWLQLRSLSLAPCLQFCYFISLPVSFPINCYCFCSFIWWLLLENSIFLFFFLRYWQRDYVFLITVLSELPTLKLLLWNTFFSLRALTSSLSGLLQSCFCTLCYWNCLSLICPCPNSWARFPPSSISCMAFLWLSGCRAVCAVLVCFLLPACASTDVLIYQLPRSGSTSSLQPLLSLNCKVATWSSFSLLQLAFRLAKPQLVSKI